MTEHFFETHGPVDLQVEIGHREQAAIAARDLLRAQQWGNDGRCRHPTDSWAGTTGAGTDGTGVGAAVGVGSCTDTMPSTSRAAMSRR